MENKENNGYSSASKEAFGSAKTEKKLELVL
jgi:hypothetical protein